MRKITNNQLFELMKRKNINIIDIRDEYKFKKSHIINSINIPYRYLITNPSQYLNKQDNYVIICDYGITSDDATEKLYKLGYNVTSVINGISKWQYGLTS